MKLSKENQQCSTKNNENKPYKKEGKKVMLKYTINMWPDIKKEQIDETNFIRIETNYSNQRNELPSMKAKNSFISCKNTRAFPTVRKRSQNEIKLPESFDEKAIEEKNAKKLDTFFQEVHHKNPNDILEAIQISSTIALKFQKTYKEIITNMDQVDKLVRKSERKFNTHYRIVGPDLDGSFTFFTKPVIKKDEKIQETNEEKKLNKSRFSVEDLSENGETNKVKLEKIAQKLKETEEKSEAIRKNNELIKKKYCLPFPKAIKRSNIQLLACKLSSQKSKFVNPEEPDIGVISFSKTLPLADMLSVKYKKLKKIIPQETKTPADYTQKEEGSGSMFKFPSKSVSQKITNASVNRTSRKVFKKPFGDPFVFHFQESKLISKPWHITQTM